MPASSPLPPLTTRLPWLLVPTLFLFGGLSRGMVETFTVFVLPLQEALGVDRAEVTAIYSLALLTGGLAAPLAGRSFDRLGARATYGAGAVLLGLGLVIAGFGHAVWQYQIGLGILGGFAVAALGNVPHGALLSRWFKRRLGTMVALVYSSSGIGMLVLVPLAQWLIDRFDWRTAYFTLALTISVVLLAVAALPWRRLEAGDASVMQAESIVDGNAPAHGADDWTVRKAMATLPFWGLTACFAFTGCGVVTIAVQAVAYLIENDIPPLAAAGAWGFVGMLQPIGMVGFGWLDGIIGRRPSVALSYALTLTGMLVLWLAGQWHNPLLLTAMVLCLGLSMGARGPLVAAIAARIYPGRNFGSIYGSMVLGGGIGSSFGALLGGVVHDFSGSYTPVFVVGAISLILGASPYWTIKRLAHD